MNKYLFIIIFSLVYLNILVAQTKDDDQAEERQLSKTTTSIEDAFGILDKGELINTLGNQGMISDSYYQNLIYNFRWPKSKGVGSITNDVNAMDDLCLLFASKGNVLDSYTRYRAEDWMGVAGALGHYHSDDQPEYLLAPDGAPRLAHSDIPLTWPKGYFDESKTWQNAPTGNYSSLSEEDKKLVDSKGAFYDSNKNVWRFWPGHFRKDIDPDSPTFGKEVPGEFAADREIYLIADDRNAQPPTYSMGMTLEIQAYSYGRRFAQDIHFYDIKITNNGTEVRDSCYFGYYMDFQFGDVLEETYGSFNTNINSKGFDNAFYQYDYNGSSPGNIEVGYFGTAILKTPFDLGITDAHFFRDLTGNITPADDRSIWPVMISDPNSTKLMSAKENYFHGSNIHFDDFDLTKEGKTPGPSNWTLMADSGPFTLNPGESMEATLAVSAGNDLEDLKNNFQIAQSLFINSFLGPSTPPSPTLHGVAGDNKVTLYWDDISEKSVDLVSKKKDFQGYKIYRSQDQGATWGKQITDAKGNLVGYVPIAQFDKDDLIQGIDPFNNYNFLGNNTGIVHSYVDSLVLNGVNYSYTITAYDSGSVSIGLESLESSRGTTTADANLIDITPRSDAIGFKDAAFEISQSSDIGNGEVLIDLVDPNEFAELNYKIGFNSTPADSFYLFKETDNSLLLKSPINITGGNVINGITVAVTGDKSTGEIIDIKNHLNESVFGEKNLSGDGKWFVKQLNKNDLADLTSKGTDYEFRFTLSGSFAAGLTGNNKPMIKKYAVPFEIWNVGNSHNNYQISCILLDKNKNDAFDLGEEIRVVNSIYKGESDTIGTFSLLNWYHSITIDTLEGNKGRFPLDGESFTIFATSQLTSKDTFLVKIIPPEISYNAAEVKREIESVRAVPNPFVVNAAWEQIENNRRMRFMFLPPKCTISIYNVRGELVNTLYHENETGDEDWNLTNFSGVEISFGVYLFVVKTPTGEQKIGKFAVIK